MRYFGVHFFQARASVGMFREDLIVAIFEFMLEQIRVVQGFLLVVHPKACSLLWVFQKPLRRCDCVPMLRDAFCSWCNHASD